MNNKKYMIDWICDTFIKYPTMNSWNGSYGFAQNVKIHNIFSGEDQDRVYELLMGDESELYHEEINYLIEEWERTEGVKFGCRYERKERKLAVVTGMERQKASMAAAGWTFERAGTEIATYFKDNVKTSDYSIGFNGRSGGYLVLYKWNGYNYCGTGWHFDREELEEMTRDEVDQVYKILRSFDKCIKDIKKLVLSWVK